MTLPSHRPNRPTSPRRRPQRTSRTRPGRRLDPRCKHRRSPRPRPPPPSATTSSTGCPGSVAQRPRSLTPPPAGPPLPRNPAPPTRRCTWPNGPPHPDRDRPPRRRRLRSRRTRERRPDRRHCRRAPPRSRNLRVNGMPAPRIPCPQGPRRPPPRRPRPRPDTVRPRRHRPLLPAPDPHGRRPDPHRRRTGPCAAPARQAAVWSPCPAWFAPMGTRTRPSVPSAASAAVPCRAGPARSPGRRWAPC